MIKKRSYKLKLIKELSNDDNVVCIIGKVVSLEPFLLEEDGKKVKLLVDDSSKFSIGDYLRVFVRLSYSEEIPFGKPDIIQKIDLDEDEIDLYLDKYKKYVGEKYGCSNYEG